MSEQLAPAVEHIEDPSGSIFLAKFRQNIVSRVVALSDNIVDRSFPLDEDGQRERYMKRFLTLRRDPELVLGQIAAIDATHAPAHFRSLDFSLLCNRGLPKISRPTPAKEQRRIDQIFRHSAAIQETRRILEP